MRLALPRHERIQEWLEQSLTFRGQFLTIESLPAMSKNAFGGTDEIRMPSVLSCQSDDNGSRVGQGDASGDSRPAVERGTLEVKKEKDAAKEAFNGGTLAEFLLGPGGSQAGALLLPLGIPGNNGDYTEHAGDAADETQAAIGCIQADHTRTNRKEAHGPLQQGLSKGGIMHIGRRDRHERGPARPVTNRARLDRKAATAFARGRSGARTPHVATWGASWSGRQWGRAAPVGKAHGYPAQRPQMQRGHQRHSVNM